MILYSFVRMRICSHILYILANITLRRIGIWLKHHEEKLKTHEANDPTCFCLTEYLQPYISPNVFTFPSMAVCVFWIYGKGKYLRHSTARLRATEQFSILMHLVTHDFKSPFMDGKYVPIKIQKHQMII